MIEARLKAEIIVQSAIRRAAARGVPATVVRRGDPDAGQVFVVLNQGREIGFSVLAPARDYDTGTQTWRAALGPGPEGEADGYLEKERRIDPDLWVIEIESRDGWHPFGDDDD